MVQTSPGSEAKINASGSSVRVFADSRVQFQGGDLVIEQGGVNVATSKALAMRAGAVTVAPSSKNTWTQFEVRYVDEEVQIVAVKGDVNVSTQSTTSTVSEGQEKSVSDQTGQDQTADSEKKKRKKKAGAAVPGQGGTFTKTSALVLVGATAGTVGIMHGLRNVDPALLALLSLKLLAGVWPQSLCSIITARFRRSPGRPLNSSP